MKLWPNGARVPLSDLRGHPALLTVAYAHCETVCPTIVNELHVATTSPATDAARPEVDQIVETIIYLYTESRRLTKGLASQFGLTGPQLTVIKLLETFDNLSLSSLSERIRAQNSTVTGIIDRMERDGIVTRTRSEEDRRVVRVRVPTRVR